MTDNKLMDLIDITPDKVELGEILQKVGFSSTEVGFKYDFDFFELRACRVFDPFRGGDVYHFYAYYVTPRSIGELDFVIPSFVDSYEQGVAFIYYHLRKTPGKKSNIPFWLIEGYSYYDLLPWRSREIEQERDHEAFLKAPKAFVEYEYIKIIIKKLKHMVTLASDSDTVKFSFDGEVFKIVCNNEILAAAPAKGQKWEKEAFVKTLSLENLPNRIQHRSHSAYILDDNLHFLLNKMKIINNDIEI